MYDSGEEKAGHLKNEEGKGRMSTMLPNLYFLFPHGSEGHRQPGLRHLASLWRCCLPPTAQIYIRGGTAGEG